MKGCVEQVENMGREAETCKLVVAEYICSGDQERHDDENKKRTAHISLGQKLQHVGMYLQSDAQSARFLEERMQNTHKAWWRCARIHRNIDVFWRIKCKRMMEPIHRVFISGLESAGFGPKTRIGHPYLEHFILFQKKRGRDVGRLLFENSKICRGLWKQQELPFSSDVIAESMWSTPGWVSGKWSNAVLESMQPIFAWESTCWWRDMEALNIVEAQLGMAKSLMCPEQVSKN